MIILEQAIICVLVSNVSSFAFIFFVMNVYGFLCHRLSKTSLSINLDDAVLTFECVLPI